MKCISIIQPWASLIIIGAKKIETRSWATKFRGRLLIHASKTIPAYCKSLAGVEPFFSALQAINNGGGNPLPTGVILGSVNLGAVIQVENVGRLTEQERAFGNFAPGRFAWLLTDPTPLVSPIAFKGVLGIYDVPDHILQGAVEVSHA